jgi:hypothetical protein
MFFIWYGILMITQPSHSALNLLALCLTTIFFIAFATPKLALDRELYADGVAVDLEGAHNTLSSAVWMARRCHDIDAPERQARLNRLRKLLRSTTSTIA